MRNRPMVPNVLVVEPYADLRAGIVAVLERLHLDCDSVSTASDAMLKLTDRSYAHVIVDIDDDTAESVADLVRSLDPRAHVVLISDGDPRDVRSHDRVVLRKPFAREELVAQFARRET